MMMKRPCGARYMMTRMMQTTTKNGGERPEKAMKQMPLRLPLSCRRRWVGGRRGVWWGACRCGRAFREACKWRGLTTIKDEALETEDRRVRVVADWLAGWRRASIDDEGLDEAVGVR